MLKPVFFKKKRFDDYRGIIKNRLFDEIKQIAAVLHGKRVLYINSNQNQGGVYEHLVSLVPLMQDLGLQSQWKAITEVPADFYDVTKSIYNNIQGADCHVTSKGWLAYEQFNREIAKQIEGQPWDFIFVQDHQMMGALSQIAEKGKTQWIWQSHSETHKPKHEFVVRLKQYLLPYDAAIFYLPDYVFPDFRPKHIVTSTIAIDPISPNNTPVGKAHARSVMQQFGVDVSRPVVTQISRVDSWKDFPGLVDAWIRSKTYRRDIQLVIIGAVSPNNVHAEAIIAQVRSKLVNETGAFLLINKVEREKIKAFQSGSDVVLQKSLREGFGLTVSEALWQKTPVIGGNVGGIRVQIVDGKGGYLVDSVEDCAHRIIELIQDREKATAMGAFGREHIRAHFLLPRLIRDELKLMVDLLNS